MLLLRPLLWILRSCACLSPLPPPLPPPPLPRRRRRPRWFLSTAMSAGLLIIMAVLQCCCAARDSGSCSDMAFSPARRDASTLVGCSRCSAPGAWRCLRAVVRAAPLLRHVAGCAPAEEKDTLVSGSMQLSERLRHPRGRRMRRRPRRVYLSGSLRASVLPAAVRRAAHDEQCVPLWLRKRHRRPRATGWRVPVCRR